MRSVASKATRDVLTGLLHRGYSMFELLYMHIQHLVDRFRRDEHGAALVEYGILVGLIAVICIAAVAIIGTQLSTAFSIVGSALTPGI
jgi:pilus assembly protein Flp/PilA